MLRRSFSLLHSERTQKYWMALEHSPSSFAVVDRMELVQEQQFGQLACILTVVLFPTFNRAFLPESQTNTSVTSGFKRSCNKRHKFLLQSSRANYRADHEQTRGIVSAFVWGFHHQISNPEPPLRSLLYAHPSQYTEGAPCCRR